MDVPTNPLACPDVNVPDPGFTVTAPFVAIAMKPSTFPVF